MKTLYKLLLATILIATFSSCESEVNEIFYEIQNSGSTNIQIVNKSQTDSVKVYLTLQSPNSVVGMFGIEDTTGSKSQGYFYAVKNKSYYLDSDLALFGWNVSFETPPMSCSGAIDNGYPNGINIVEGSINCEFEVFDISCVDGANCVLRVSVSDTIDWSTGNGTNQQRFMSVENSVDLQLNCGRRGVFPYRCSDCIRINPNNVPANCFDLPLNCSSERVCQVARTNNKGGVITIEYFGDESIGTKKTATK
jgi:hypothetical protein